jgi:hypothetical protein
MHVLLTYPKVFEEQTNTHLRVELSAKVGVGQLLMQRPVTLSAKPTEHTGTQSLVVSLAQYPKGQLARHRLEIGSLNSPVVQRDVHVLTRVVGSANVLPAQYLTQILF